MNGGITLATLMYLYELDSGLVADGAIAMANSPTINQNVALVFVLGYLEKFHGGISKPVGKFDSPKPKQEVCSFSRIKRGNKIGVVLKNLPPSTQNIHIALYDLNGRCVSKQIIKNIAQETCALFDISKLSRQLFLLRITGEHLEFNMPLIITGK